MVWFLERISAKNLPVIFGAKERQEHPDDFEKLLKKKALKKTGNLDSVPCDLCDNDHECQVRDNNGELFYICENGCGKKTLSDDDLAVYEYDNDAFLKLVSDELSIKTNHGNFADEAVYSNSSFYNLGVFTDNKIQADIYYLRTSDAYEPASLFEHIGNKTKVLITNTTKPEMIYGKEGTRYCVLSDILASATSNKIFDASKFKKCLEGIRRVRFDKKQAQLSLDNKLVYTAGINSPEHHFLSCLWDHWQEQMPHSDIHSYVRNELGKDVADPAQKFCNKMKSNIKKSYSGIEKIITNPTVGHYMISDPS